MSEAISTVSYRPSSSSKSTETTVKIISTTDHGDNNHHINGDGHSWFSTAPTTSTTSTEAVESNEISSATSPSTTVAGSGGGQYFPEKESRKDHFKVICYFTNWAWYR